ncbi:MAG: VWA domain-containing protein [Planctomycetes bacterium]|nr:VWA domain-containing protein [Planctomycetota bacterium]
MDWPDWKTLHIAHPEMLPWVGLCALVGAATLVLPWRHAKGVVAAAGMVRCLAIGVLVLAIAGFVNVQSSEVRFQPAGTWRLLLPGAEAPANPHARDFSEPPAVFINRVRNELVGEAPPATTEVHAAEREAALAARDAVRALGVPCRAFYPAQEALSPTPLITGIEAPVSVKPGEPFTAQVRRAGPEVELRVSLDGKPLSGADGRCEVRSDVPGRHVLEAVLLDAEGRELQRAGQVIRVGEKPRALALGLDGKQLARATALAPDLQFTVVSAEEFRGASLGDEQAPIELVLASVDSLNRLSAEQAFTLAGFVARGGGLFVTGDGAKYVAPEYLHREVRGVLPVILQKEGKQPPPDKPPLEEEPIKAEIAKVSICFVLDRSGSMDTPVGDGKATRWQIACKGVIESLKLIDQGGRRDLATPESESFATRVGIMSFTLSQNWIDKPRTFLKFDREFDLPRRLRAVEGDREFAELYTNTDIYAAMEEAINVMKDEPSAVKVIVMMTDGADRPKNTLEGKKHTDLRDAAVANQINIVAVGIGDEFSGAGAEALAARQVITDLATRPEFAKIPAAQDAAKAYTIFVDTVETAFQAYDDKKRQEEEARKRRLEEQQNRELEPEKVEVMPGTFPLHMGVVGEQLFGRESLPDPAPKVQWLARNFARDGAAVALSAITDDASATPVLVFKGYGLGRVGFWGAGTDPEALGELTGWADFPAIFAASLRWLLPREQPDLRLLGEATPEAIRILDPIEEATYLLRTQAGDRPLALNDGELTGGEPLPPGPAEVIESVPSESGPIERAIGDVYVAVAPPVVARQLALDEDEGPATLQARPPEVTSLTREATLPLLYLLTLVLLIMPIERLIRRRS